jgi:hypothetical protein
MKKTPSRNLLTCERCSTSVLTPLSKVAPALAVLDPVMSDSILRSRFMRDRSLIAGLTFALTCPAFLWMCGELANAGPPSCYPLLSWSCGAAPASTCVAAGCTLPLFASGPYCSGGTWYVAGGGYTSCAAASTSGFATCNTDPTTNPGSVVCQTSQSCAGALCTPAPGSSPPFVCSGVPTFGTGLFDANPTPVVPTPATTHTSPPITTTTTSCPGAPATPG